MHGQPFRLTKTNLLTNLGHLVKLRWRGEFFAFISLCYVIYVNIFEKLVFPMYLLNINFSSNLKSEDQEMKRHEKTGMKS